MIRDSIQTKRSANTDFDHEHSTAMNQVENIFHDPLWNAQLRDLFSLALFMSRMRNAGFGLTG